MGFASPSALHIDRLFGQFFGPNPVSQMCPRTLRREPGAKPRARPPLARAESNGGNHPVQDGDRPDSGTRSPEAPNPQPKSDPPSSCTGVFAETMPTTIQSRAPAERPGRTPSRATTARKIEKPNGFKEAEARAHESRQQACTRAARRPAHTHTHKDSTRSWDGCQVCPWERRPTNRWR